MRRAPKRRLLKGVGQTHALVEVAQPFDGPQETLDEIAALEGETAQVLQAIKALL